MIFRTTIALTFVAILASASAAMAAPTHRPYRAVQQHASTATEASIYAAAGRFRNQPGPYYYDQGSSGSVWSYYPGFVPMTRE